MRLIKNQAINDEPAKKRSPAIYSLLHFIVLLYSIGGIIAKKNAIKGFFSAEWIMNYGIILSILFVYALVWQLIIKHISLTIAFCNKAMTLVWGIIWGYLFFDEYIGVRKIIGAVIVMVGIWMVVLGDRSSE